MRGTRVFARQTRPYSKMTSGNHKVFNAGKPHPILESVENLKVTLDDAGIL